MVGRTTIDPNNAVEGSRLIIGNKQIEVRTCTNVSLYSIWKKSGKINSRL